MLRVQENLIPANVGPSTSEHCASQRAGQNVRAAFVEWRCNFATLCAAKATDLFSVGFFFFKCFVLLLYPIRISELFLILDLFPFTNSGIFNFFNS